jgi:hypothetical protein
MTPTQPAPGEGDLGRYYARGGKVWREPVASPNENGTRNIALGFLVCTPGEGLRASAAETIASLMHDGEAYRKSASPDLLRACEMMLSDMEVTQKRDTISMHVAREAIAKATGAA